MNDWAAGHGTIVLSKDYASWISSKQDMSEMEKIEGKLGSGSSALLSK